MEDILDDEQFDGATNENLTSNIKLRTGIYFTIMFVIGIAFVLFISEISPTFYNLLLGPIISICLYLFLGTIIVLIRIFFRRRKDKKKGITTMYDPIWFQIVEVSFVWYIFLMAITFLGRVV